MDPILQLGMQSTAVQDFGTYYSNACSPPDPINDVLTHSLQRYNAPLRSYTEFTNYSGASTKIFNIWGSQMSTGNTSQNIPSTVTWFQPVWTRISVSFENTDRLSRFIVYLQEFSNSPLDATAIALVDIRNVRPFTPQSVLGADAILLDVTANRTGANGSSTGNIRPFIIDIFWPHTLGQPLTGSSQVSTRLQAKLYAEELTGSFLNLNVGYTTYYIDKRPAFDIGHFQWAKWYLGIGIIKAQKYFSIVAQRQMVTEWLQSSIENYLDVQPLVTASKIPMTKEWRLPEVANIIGMHFMDLFFEIWNQFIYRQPSIAETTEIHRKRPRKEPEDHDVEKIIFRSFTTNPVSTLASRPEAYTYVAPRPHPLAVALDNCYPPAASSRPSYPDL